MLRFSDDTWRALKRSGLRMVFYGAESGSDAVLKQMNKTLTIAQTLELAARTREHGIVPEFSFVLGGPEDPAAEIAPTILMALGFDPTELAAVRQEGTTALPGLGQ